MVNRWNIPVAGPSCKEYNQYEIDLRNFLDATVDLSSYEDTIEFKDLKIKLKPQSFKSANTTNLEVFEQQRLITLVNDQTLDADQKQTKFNEIFEKMTSLTVKNIIGSIGIYFDCLTEHEYQTLVLSTILLPTVIVEFLRKLKSIRQRLTR